MTKLSYADARKSDRYAEKDVPISTLDPLALDNGVIKGFIAIYGNRDHGGDRLVNGCFRKSLAEHGGKGFPIGWQHDLADPLGVWDIITEVGRDALPGAILAIAPDATGGLYGEGHISQRDLSQDRFKSVKDGTVPGLSIGYEALVQRQVKDADGNWTRELKECRLWEGSTVTIGMNGGALTTFAKSAEEAITPRNPALHLPLYRKAVGESQTYLRQRLQDALQDAYPRRASYSYYDGPMMQADADGPGCCIQDIYADAVIVNDADYDSYWEIPYALASNGNVTLDTAAARLVKIVYQPVGQGSEEAIETASAPPPAASKAGRRNSSTDTGRLVAAHDALHAVLDLPAHATTPSDDDDDDDAKAMAHVRQRLASARTGAPLLEVA